MAPLGRISTQTSLPCWMMLELWGFAFCGVFLLFDFDILHFAPAKALDLSIGWLHWVGTELDASSTIRMGALGNTP